MFSDQHFAFIFLKPSWISGNVGILVIFVQPPNSIVGARSNSSPSSVTQSCLTLCTPRTAACQPSLSSTSPRSLLKLMPIEPVMLSNYLILCSPLILLPSIFPSIRVFSNESVLHIRWANYWSFSFSISPSNEYSGLISLRLTGLIS